MSEVVAPGVGGNEQNTLIVNRLRRMVFVFGGNAVALFALIVWMEWVR